MAGDGPGGGASRRPGAAGVAAAARRWAPLLAVGALLGAAVLAAALSSTQVTNIPLPVPTSSLLPRSGSPRPGQSPGPSAAGSPAEAWQLPGWVTSLALGLCLLVVIAIVLAVVWVLVRNTLSVRTGTLPVEEGAVPLQPRTRDVLAAVDAGLADLSEADRDPRRAVIACWVRLEQAAAAAGTPRRLGDTSTDLVLRLLREHRVDRRVLDRFAEIYREARYATHVVDETMRGQARSALRQLRTELTAPAPTADVAP
jgi:hypothetical protein